MSATGVAPARWPVLSPSSHPQLSDDGTMVLGPASFPLPGPLLNHRGGLPHSVRIAVDPY